MNESSQLNNTFHALADPTRRQIIGMLIEQQEQRITDLAEPFAISLAAVSKHIRVLERADLVSRVKRGREYFLQLNIEPLKEAREWVGFYEQFWRQRFARLESLLAENKSTKSKRGRD